ncbi:hypothetical protein G5C60_12470 [Streptomyces sp. HC44]|uniref:Uncharacterized protein n=1 Tax=Streptomyces scabichelini TaxID=2711217 RepID=A0A6G4V2X5_9ACTN|nr:hypothetical protein [Streptomyces scabichelini]NGO08412.1 hypothetical protein [Streptomyces scabichelini]
MDMLATSPTAPELQSPFAGFAGLSADPADAGERPQPTTGVVLDSPFGSGLRTEETEAGADVLTELLSELADDEFEDAVAQLVDDAAGAHLQGETAWSAGEGSRAGLQSWAEALAEQSDRLLDGITARLEHEDLTAMPARDLDALLESLAPEPVGAREVVFEQFLGGLLKKAGSLVKGVVKIAKKGISAVSKILPIGILLKKLGGLVRPLLARVIKSAMNRLPATVRPIAEQIAKKLGIAGGAGAAAAPATAAGTGDTEPSAASQLAGEFDRNVLGLLLAPDEIAADGVLAEAATDAEAETPDPIGELDAARRELGRRLTELPAGSYPKPEVQQFLPVVMAALPLIKLGLKIIGRQRVVDFIAERIADLLRSMVGPGPAKQIARPIVDVGMKLIGLEVPPEAETDVAGEALAATVETTARRALALPAAVQDDRLLLDAAVQQFFAEAAAAHLPGRLLRADLPERESEHESGVWVLMPRAAAPRYRFLRYTRPFEIQVSRQVARAVPWSDGGTLESHLLDRGVRHWPTTAEAHLYEMLPGGHLGHLRHDDTLRGVAGEAEDIAEEVAPLTPEIAGLLLGEPGLGRPAPGGAGAARPGAAPGRRFVRLRPKGRAAGSMAGRAAGPRARVGVHIDTTATPPRLRVSLRLSERQAQEMLDLLTRAEGPDLPGALRKMQQAHRSSLVPRLTGQLVKRSLLPDAAAAKTAAEQLATAVDTGLSAMLQGQTAQLTAAVRDPAQGLTIKLDFEGVTRESLQGTPPEPTVTVTPGWRSGG